MKPSLEEEEIILQLERGLSEVLGSEDFSDIIDELDEDIQGEVEGYQLIAVYGSNKRRYF